MFTEQDIEQIGAHGLCVADAERQLLRFREGFPYLDICRAAVAGDGILQADGAAAERYGAVYRELRPQRKVVKFVPASGAATRMFKALFEFLNDGVRSREVDELLAGLDRFAFAERLAEFTGGSRDPRTVVSNILTEGLGYGTLPKALILFHRYPDRNRTAFEEHLAEGALYAAGAGSEVCIHFTVSAEHREQFERLAAETVPFYEARFGVKYRIGYSCQKPSTDTLAVNPDDTPLRDGQGLGQPFAWGCCFSFTNFPLRRPVYQSFVCCGESVFRHSVSFRMVYCPCLLLCPVICYACGVGPVCPS